MSVDDHDLGPFPDPSAPGDGDANTSLTQIVARVQVWTGSVWKRLTLGQTTKTGSVPVTLASDQGDVSASQGTGAGASGFWSVRLSDGTSFYAAPSSAQLPASLVGGRLDVNAGAWLGSAAPTVGQKPSADSIPVVVASDQSRLPVAGEVQLDYDTGAGTQSLSIVGLALPDSGGAVAGGTSANPFRTDPTGTTTQPVTVATALPTGTNTIGAVTAPGAAALALDATLTGGTAKAIVRGAAKGATAAADATTTAQGADHQGVDVQVRDTSGNPMPSMDTAARRGFVALTDGTNTAAVKAASTASVATDPSAVVALSPNSPLPTGSNTIGAVTAPGAAALATAALQGTTFDLDTGAGTQNVAGVSLRKSGAGGSAELGTSSDPVRVDPTGTTRQPVDHGATYTAVSSTALEGSHVLKTSAGTLFTVTVWIDAGAAKAVYYLQLFNATALPVDGTAVTFRAPIPIDHQNGSYEILTVDEGQGGIPFSTGMVAAVSTTAFTLTAAGAVAAFNASVE